MNKKLTSAAISGAFAATLLSGTAIAADVTENPFATNVMESGYQVAMSGKADEGKCGEGKCGASKDGAKKEGKCGEGKCGDKK
jgi:uncharacterized low-complexity protein